MGFLPAAQSNAILLNERQLARSTHERSTKYLKFYYLV